MAVKRVFNDRHEFSDSTGNNALSGGKLFIYLAGSTTKATTYNSSLGTVPNSNPMILDAAGRLQAELWVTTGQNYKLVLTTSTDSDPPAAPIWTEDNISGIDDFPATAVTGEWIASGLTPTYISATSFSFTGDQTSIFTAGRALQIVDAGGTKYGFVKTSVFGAITTITLDQNSTALSNPLSSVAYGILQSTNSSTPILADTIPLRGGSADESKQVRIETDGIATGTTRVITMPDNDVNLMAVPTIKRKTADESVISSIALQNDDDLTFSIRANEEWVADFFLDVGTNLSVSKFKLAITVPAGATMNVTASGVGTSATDTSQIRTTSSGTGITLGFTGSGDALIMVSVWVLNSTNAGSVTLQWAQSVSNAVNTTVRKGSHMIALRVA